MKKLKVSSLQGDREFRIDVKIISRIHHRYLDFLVRYYSSEHQRLRPKQYTLSSSTQIATNQNKNHAILPLLHKEPFKA